MSSVELTAELIRTGIPADELASVLGVPQTKIDAWLAGNSAVPDWVPATIRLFSLLTPVMRRKLLDGSAVVSREHPIRSHQYSRIEEL